jgi:hypothetical protein
VRPPLSCLDFGFTAEPFNCRETVSVANVVATKAGFKLAGVVGVADKLVATGASCGSFGCGMISAGGGSCGGSGGGGIPGGRGGKGS